MQSTMQSILQVLTYRGRVDLARLLIGSRYILNVSDSYGSRLYSQRTTVELYSPLHKFDQLRKLDDTGIAVLLDAFHVVYPIRDNDVEIVDFEFFVDPNAPIPSPLRKTSRLDEIDFVYITDQISKCDEKIAVADFEGAITNARNLMESICKYILDDAAQAYDAKKDDLPSLYRKTIHVLNMHPNQHTVQSFKQILQGGISIVHGLAAIRNELSDAHGKSKTAYRANERHAMLSVGIAKSLAEFMFASYADRITGSS